MRLASLQHASSQRRKLAVILVLSLPAAGLSEERSNSLRSPQGAQSPIRSATVTTGPTIVPLVDSPNEQPIDQPALVPLSLEMTELSRSPLLLIGPVSTGLPSATANAQPVADDDWLPRGMRSTRPTPRSQEQLPPSLCNPPSVSPQPQSERAGSQTLHRLAPRDLQTPLLHTAPSHSTFQIDPSQFRSAETTCAGTDGANVGEPTADAAAPAAQQSVAVSVASGNAEADDDSDDESLEGDSQDLQAVTDPEQNEPSGPADLTDAPSAHASVGDEIHVLEERAPHEPLMEIRRLKAREQLGDAQMARVPARTVGNRVARGVTVGDVSPDGEVIVDAKPIARPTDSAGADNPIHGDRITAAGELILASGASAANLRLLPQTAQLKVTIEKALRYYWDNPEDSAERTHWGMMHSIMVFDKDTQIVHRRQRYNAVAWMAGNNPCRNQLLLTRDQQGIVVRTGVGLQGHQAQLLAIFGLINVPLNYPVYVARQKFSVENILDREMLDCKSGNELTFTLIALAHYTDSDTTWLSADQQDWDVQRVIREELSQPIVGSACGGTHRMMGFAHALRRRRAEGKPIVDQWDRADRYVAEFIDYTWSLQNRDGSMSTAWFERSEDNGNMDRKIQTTGHMLEFLLSTVPDADLQSPEMIRTVGYLANTLYAERGHQWQVGPKGHALRALAMYYQRVYGDSTPWRNQPSEQSASAGGGSRRPLR